MFVTKIEIHHFPEYAYPLHAINLNTSETLVSFVSFVKTTPPGDPISAKTVRQTNNIHNFPRHMKLFPIRVVVAIRAKVTAVARIATLLKDDLRARGKALTVKSLSPPPQHVRYKAGGCERPST